MTHQLINLHNKTTRNVKQSRIRVQKRQTSKNSSLNFVNSIKGFIPVYSKDKDKNAVITHYDVCIQSQAVSVGSMKKNARTQFISVSVQDVNNILDHLQLELDSDFSTLGVNKDFHCITNASGDVLPIQQSRLDGCCVSIGGVETTFASNNQLQVFQELISGIEYRQYEVKNGDLAGLWAVNNEMLNSQGVHCITNATSGDIQPLYISLRVLWSDTIIDGNRVADTRPKTATIDGKSVVLDGGGLPFGDSTTLEACNGFMLAEECQGYKYSKDVISALDITKLYLEEYDLFPKTLLRCAEDNVFEASINASIIELVNEWLNDEESEDVAEDVEEMK